jgi:hypothetical protein
MTDTFLIIYMIAIIVLACSVVWKAVGETE